MDLLILVMLFKHFSYLGFAQAPWAKETTKCSRHGWRIITMLKQTGTKKVIGRECELGSGTCANSTATDLLEWLSVPSGANDRMIKGRWFYVM